MLSTRTVPCVVLRCVVVQSDVKAALAYRAQICLFACSPAFVYLTYRPTQYIATVGFWHHLCPRKHFGESCILSHCTQYFDLPHIHLTCHTSGNIARINNYVLRIHRNVHTDCNFNCLIETEGVFNVKGSHEHCIKVAIYQ